LDSGKTVAQLITTLAADSELIHLENGEVLFTPMRL